MKVNTGQRVAVEMPGYEGLAGYVDREDGAEISFPARFRALPVAAGDMIMVDGQPRKVVSVTASPFLPGFVVVQLAKRAD